jgi:hypothetical protein
VNGSRQLLIYANDENLARRNLKTYKKKDEISIERLKRGCTESERSDNRRVYE